MHYNVRQCNLQTQAVIMCPYCINGKREEPQPACTDWGICYIPTGSKHPVSVPNSNLTDPSTQDRYLHISEGVIDCYHGVPPVLGHPLYVSLQERIKPVYVLETTVPKTESKWQS